MPAKSENKISGMIYPVIILFVIASVVTLSLSATNLLTGDIIERQRIEAMENAMEEVFPEGAEFVLLSDIIREISFESVDTAYKVIDGNSEIAGLIIVSRARGYGGFVITMSGISPEGVLTGYLVLSDNETPGLGKKIGDDFFTERFVNRTGWKKFSVTSISEDINHIDSIAGATISSRAMTESANTALSFAAKVFEILEEGG